MQEQLMLVPNPDKSEVMCRAHELKADEGMSMSEALELAWSEYGEGNPRVRKAVKKVAESEGVSVLLSAGVGLVIHRLITKQWLWELIELSRQKKLAVAEAQRIAAQPKSNPSPPGYKTYIPILPAVVDEHGRTREEPISVIMP